MTSNLLPHLRKMLKAADDLLMEAVLSDTQRRFAKYIADETTELRNLILSTSNLGGERLKVLLSYDGRSRLSAIMGYADVLLEDDEPLTPEQRRLVQMIHSSGKQTLIYLSELLED